MKRSFCVTNLKGKVIVVLSRTCLFENMSSNFASNVVKENNFIFDPEFLLKNCFFLAFHLIFRLNIQSEEILKFVALSFLLLPLFIPFSVSSRDLELSRSPLIRTVLSNYVFIKLFIKKCKYNNIIN